jgi:hypothetical protein
LAHWDLPRQIPKSHIVISGGFIIKAYHINESSDAIYPCFLGIAVVNSRILGKEGEPAVDEDYR